MAVKRFLLNTSQLDDATFGLDGGIAFILDSSQLDGTRVLDGGQFLTTATGAASLGGMSAIVSATITTFAVLSAPFGGLNANASATVTEFAALSAPLGGLDANASATVTEFAVASADLGGLDANASATVTEFAIASADLGGLVATANATVIPPTPTPEPIPSGGRQYAAPRRKKIEPLPEVEIPVMQPKRRYAVCSATLDGMTAQAEAMITFSILDDDAEVLLLV